MLAPYKIIVCVMLWLLLGFSGLAGLAAPSSSSSSSNAPKPSGNVINDSNFTNAGRVRKEYTYADPNNAPFVDESIHPEGLDEVKNRKSVGPGTVQHHVSGPVYTWPIYIPTATSPVPTKRDQGIMRNALKTWGYPISDTQYQMIHRYNQNILIARLFDPEKIMWTINTMGAMQAQGVANTAANLERSQAVSAIDFTASYLYNFTVDGTNKWNKIRDQLFIPMAILILLPGAVLSQVRAIVASGSPVIGDVNPFDGIIRSIVAIFLIPATYLVINYGIDVANSITFSIADEYHKIFRSDMYKDAMCAHIRAFPIRPKESNLNAMIETEQVWEKQDPKPNSTPAADLEAKTSSNMIEDPCSNKRILQDKRADERANILSIGQRFMLNASNAALAATWNILCAFQMAYLYYLWCVGPVIAALWVWPMKSLRDALPSWIEGVITLCFWSLFWNTVILLMACFKGVDETGTIIMSALNFLANQAVKFAFDFAGLVKAAGQQAAGQALGKAAEVAKGAGSGTGQPGGGRAPAPVPHHGPAGGGGVGGAVEGGLAAAGAGGPTGSMANPLAGAGSSGGWKPVSTADAGGSFINDTAARVPASGALNDPSGLARGGLAGSGADALLGSAGGVPPGIGTGIGMAGGAIAASTISAGLGLGGSGSTGDTASLGLDKTGIPGQAEPPAYGLSPDTISMLPTTAALGMGMGALNNVDFGKGLPPVDTTVDIKSDKAVVPAIPTASMSDGSISGRVDGGYLKIWDQPWSPAMANSLIGSSAAFNTWVQQADFLNPGFKDAFGSSNKELAALLGKDMTTASMASGDPNSMFVLGAAAAGAVKDVQDMSSRATVIDQLRQWQEASAAWEARLSSNIANNGNPITTEELARFGKFQEAFNSYTSQVNSAMTSGDLSQLAQLAQAKPQLEAYLPPLQSTLQGGSPITGLPVADTLSVQQARLAAQGLSTDIAYQVNSLQQQYMPPATVDSSYLATLNNAYATPYNQSIEAITGTPQVAGTAQGAPQGIGVPQFVDTAQVAGVPQIGQLAASEMLGRNVSAMPADTSTQQILAAAATTAVPAAVAAGLLSSAPQFPSDAAGNLQSSSPLPNRIINNTQPVINQPTDLGYVVDNSLRGARVEATAGTPMLNRQLVKNSNISELASSSSPHKPETVPTKAAPLPTYIAVRANSTYAGRPYQVPVTQPANVQVVSRGNAFTRAMNLGTNVRVRQPGTHFAGSGYAKVSVPPQSSGRVESPFSDVHLASIYNRSTSKNEKRLKKALAEFAENMGWTEC